MPADGLVCGDERAVYADKAYAKEARRLWLKSLGIKPRIMHKSWGGGPLLTRWQQLHNTLSAPIRAQVEACSPPSSDGWARIKSATRARQKPKPLVLVALAYNMNRALKLA